VYLGMLTFNRGLTPVKMSTSVHEIVGLSGGEQVEPYHKSERAILYHGGCVLVMAEMEDNSVDSIVCDPPYHLTGTDSTKGFMGKTWDGGNIAYDVEMWKQCLRILRPGGYLLAFGGSRTYHRMTCAIEDVEFEIKDCVMWLFGSGFPKSHNISKAIDREAGAKRETVGRRKHPTLKDTSLIEESANAAHGENVWCREWDLTSPATDGAKRWQGWGSALKPAYEPVVVARKPLAKGNTIASNVLQYGTGAINIDACRIPGEPVPINKLEQWSGFGQEKRPEYEQEMNTQGRWPANIIIDGSDEVVECFPSTSDSSASKKRQSEYEPNGKNKVYGEGMGGGFHPGFGDGGSAARFFYCAKADGSDRNEGLENTKGNHHPTVKPSDLMRYLCRLVTPPGGTVLDPFAGSGSTGKAAILEGFNFVGIEQSEEYCAIAAARLVHAVEADIPLFKDHHTSSPDNDLYFPDLQNKINFPA
jgi:DNA modification methylase